MAFTQLFLPRGVMYSGYAWPHSDMMACCCKHGHPTALRNLVCNQLSSQSPHVRVENLFDELSVECHLAQQASRVVSVSPFEHHCYRIILMTEWVCRL